MVFLLFITAFVLSGIAAYYSVIGLIAIFAASAIPVAIMGGSLEIAKLVVASWLYRYWKHIPLLMKTYFTSALVILMIVTSMGIFGFLSKAHIDQGIPTGDVAAQIVFIDEKIKIERENIDNSRALISQLDSVVNALTTGQDRTGRRRDGSEFTISSAERALTTRRSQSKDRAALTKQIETAQANIIKLQAEKAPIASSLRAIEAEVGPIKYIAAMVYGDNPDQNTLEKSVRWLIILLISVFDPLAVLMLIAANLTQIKQSSWNNKPTVNDPGPITPQPDTSDSVDKVEEFYTPEVALVVEKEPTDFKITPETHSYLFSEKSFHEKPEGWETTGPVVATPEPVAEQPIEEPKKKRNPKKKVNTPVEQVTDDKSSSNTFEPVEAVPDLTEDRIAYMIETGDATGLEVIYKQIVKELGKKNRPKTTHWGPLKNNKNS